VLPLAEVGGGATEEPFRLPRTAFTALEASAPKKKEES
jgi:hypothetical protein